MDSLLPNQQIQAYRPQLLTARNDAEAVMVWVNMYKSSPRTWENYRRDGERLCRWTASIGKTFGALTYEDTQAYEDFLTNPGSEWISKTKYPHDDPRWKPFSGPLASSSIRQSLIAANALFKFLVATGYLAGNPFVMNRRRSRFKAKLTRYLSPGDVGEILACIGEMPSTTAREIAHKARCRWLVVLLYLTGMRISEAATAMMSGFYATRSRDGKSRWWLRFIGKGSKPANQPVSAELLSELQRYRTSIGLTPLPRPDEHIPVVARIGLRGRHNPMNRSALHLVIKTIISNTCEKLEREGRSDVAIHLEQVSAHWLRHAMGSNIDYQGGSMRAIRDLLRHESISTTSIYVHSEDDALHDDFERMHKLPG